MKLQQLRYLCQVIESRFNISEAAGLLGTSQPGISKQIRMLEQELGLDILVRSGNRIIGMTEAGKQLVGEAQRVLAGALQLEEIAREFKNQDEGQLTVATTHLHARYSLLTVIKNFTKLYPQVQLKLLQRVVSEITDAVASGEADIGISTGSDDLARHCVALDACRLHRSIITPLDHPLLHQKGRLTLRDIAAHPLIVYNSKLSSGSTVQQAFDAAGIRPHIVLSAMDADVIKAYVAAGLGIAVLQRLAYDPSRDTEIGALGADHLFPASRAKLIINRTKFLRHYMFDFIKMVAPRWTPDKVRETLSGT
jgi:LysR family transcriptional regulator, cys regulon transcriptional activator